MQADCVVRGEDYFAALGQDDQVYYFGGPFEGIKCSIFQRNFSLLMILAKTSNIGLRWIFLYDGYAS